MSIFREDWARLRRSETGDALRRAERLLKAIADTHEAMQSGLNQYADMHEAVKLARGLLNSSILDRDIVAERFAYPSEQSKYGATHVLYMDASGAALRPAKSAEGEGSGKG